MSCQTLFAVRRGLRADVVLRKNAPGGQDQREAAGGALVGGHEFGDHEAALAAHEAADVHHRRAFGRLVVAGPLHAAELVELFVADAGEGRREARDLVHDFGRMVVVHRIAERVRESHRDFPIGQAGHGRNRLAHAADAALGVGERAVLFEERRAGQEDVRVAGGFVQEQILHHDAFHRRQTGGDVLRVRDRTERCLRPECRFP